VPHLWRYQEFSAWMTDSMHDAGGPALTGPFRQMTALARLDKLFDSSVAGHRLSYYLQGVAWQAGLPMPAQPRNGVAPGGEATSPGLNVTGLIGRF